MGEVVNTPAEVPVRPHPYRPRNLIFFLSLLALLTTWFSLSRAGLMLRNAALLEKVPSSEMAQPFWVGLRFDIATACYLLVPLAILIWFPFLSLDRCRMTRRLFYWLFLAVMGILSYLLLAEFEFVREFQVRYNQVVLAYLDQSSTVGGMIWHGYPVIRYTLVWLAAMILLAWVLRGFMARVFGGAQAAPIPLTRRYVLSETVCILIAVAGLIVGIRGGLQSTPLRWGDAFKSEHDIVNQFSLNGLYTLGRTFSENVSLEADAAWHDQMEGSEARRLARELLLADGDSLLKPEESTVLRISGQAKRTLNLRPGAGRPNVVVVIMESFSAQRSGACGASEDFTPSLTRLAKEGVVFDRTFSVGPHTHQGLFGTLLSFPNLPGYENLLQSQLANQPFATLPRVLRDEGYQTLFLYNGNFAWDNMRGFFRKHGMERFIGGDDFPPSLRRGSVWGVDDREVFRRANTEFETAATKGPFLGVVLTLSNHSPFQLPPLPFEPTRNRGELNGPINGIRYADWALGEFIEDARKLAYFNNTLFVFVGDHAERTVCDKLTSANLLAHHVPLVFFAPGLFTPTEHIDHTVASQLHVMPTILGLLGLRSPQASWGRDLFTVEGREKSVAIFKGSSGERAMAFVRGNRLLAIDEAGREKLYRYTLTPVPSVVTLDRPADTLQRDEMVKQMFAILQSGADDLRSLRAGPQLAAAVAGPPTAAEARHDQRTPQSIH